MQLYVTIISLSIITSNITFEMLVVLTYKI